MIPLSSLSPRQLAAYRARTQPPGFLSATPPAPPPPPPSPKRTLPALLATGPTHARLLKFFLDCLDAGVPLPSQAALTDYMCCDRKTFSNALQHLRTYGHVRTEMIRTGRLGEQGWTVTIVPLGKTIRS